MSARSVAGVRRRRRERRCTEATWAFKSGSGRPIWSRPIRRGSAPNSLNVRLDAHTGLPGSCCTVCGVRWSATHALDWRGDIEADETIVGGPVKGKRGRGVTSSATNTLVFGAVEVISYVDKHGQAAERAGRIRLAISRKADEESIGQFLMQNVGQGSTVRTDGWKGYSKTALANYHHMQSPGARAAHIHRAFGNLKTWLNGTHHGVDPKYLQTYLDEFVFRFNRRKTPMAAFQTLLGIVTCKSPQTLTDLKKP